MRGTNELLGELPVPLAPDLPVAGRSSVARGQAIFNSRPITITGVAGINDDVSEGGLVSSGIPALPGACGTCHDTPNVGNHSFPTPLNNGTGNRNPSNAGVNIGGLDIADLRRSPYAS